MRLGLGLCYAVRRPKIGYPVQNKSIVVEYNSVVVRCESIAGQHALAIKLLKLLTRYNETAFPVDYKGKMSNNNPYN